MPDKTKTVQQLVLEMRSLWATFDENELVYAEKGTAAAAKRARMALGDLKKLVTPYRKALVEEIAEGKKPKAPKGKK